MKFLTSFFILCSLMFKANLRAEVILVATKPIATNIVVKMVDQINIDEKRLLVIRDDVNEGVIDPLIIKMNKLDKEKKDPIYLIINTRGGQIDSGMSLVTTITSIKSPVICIIDNKAYSMGAVIATYCPKTYIHKYATVMFHYAAYGVRGPENIVPSRLAIIQKELKKLHLEVASNLGITYDQYIEKIRNEWWMTAEEAVSNKVADVLINKLSYTFEQKVEIMPFIFGLTYYTDKFVFDVRMK